LTLIHIIPVDRIRVSYLATLNYSSNKSWIKVLENHHINPWKKISKWTVVPRKVKAWLFYKALLTPVRYIKWRGACGLYDALSDI